MENTLQTIRYKFIEYIWLKYKTNSIFWSNLFILYLTKKAPFHEVSNGSNTNNNLIAYRYFYIKVYGFIWYYFWCLQLITPKDFLLLCKIVVKIYYFNKRIIMNKMWRATSINLNKQKRKRIFQFIFIRTVSMFTRYLSNVPLMLCSSTGYTLMTYVYFKAFFNVIMSKIMKKEIAFKVRKPFPLLLLINKYIHLIVCLFVYLLVYIIISY